MATASKAITEIRTRRVLGKDLRTGDVIKVGPGNGKSDFDTIFKMVPYTGKLAYLFNDGAKLVDFLHRDLGMTIDCGEYYTVMV